MLKILLLLALLISCLFLQNCSSATSETLQSKVEVEQTPQPSGTLTEKENKIQLPLTGKANFRGVSFNYNPQIFSEVIAREAEALPLENETDKPDSVMPKRILFTLKLQRNLPYPESEGTLEIIPIEDYRRMYAISDKLVKIFDEQLKIVKKEIGNKNLPKKNDIPILPFWDNHNVFNAKVKQIQFQRGIGIFWLTQWSQDFESLFENEHLTLMFQGISDDDKYYVLAEIPVISSFLPENEKEFENYKLPTRYDEFEKHQKEYDNYITKITKRLETLPSKVFKPNLDELEKIISTLKVEK